MAGNMPAKVLPHSKCADTDNLIHRDIKGSDGHIEFKEIAKDHA